MDNVSERLESVAGRRICNPKFLAECDHLHKAWTLLPDGERPTLPLPRTPICQEIPNSLEAKPASKGLADFLTAFDQFCDRWSLLGMSTWDLPNPGGLTWPQLTLGPQSTHSETVTLRSPVDFPVLESDGLGAIARDQHAASAQKTGIEDLKRWETYSRLLEIDHWERVLKTRYAVGARPRKYVTFLEVTIGRIVNLDVERVHKLRKWMRALNSGRRTNLPSSR
jgi:hypothetical protein